MGNNNNIKQASRLTGSLLARKGAAAPSQASLLLNQQVVGDRFSAAQPDGKENLRGMMPSSNKNITIKQNEEVANKFPVSVKQGKVSKKISNNLKSRKDPAVRPIAMTLRMQEENHLKLRIFSAYSRKSCQVILSEALELYLKEYEDIILSGEFAAQKTVKNGV